MIRRYPSSGWAYTYAQKNPSIPMWALWWLVIMAGLFAVTNGQYHSGRHSILIALFPNVNHWVWVDY